MKIKVLKATPDYDVDAVVDIEDKDAQKLIAKGYAQEVKATDAALTEASVELEGVFSALTEKAIETVVAESEKRIAKNLKAKRQTLAVSVHDNVDDDPQHGFKSLGEFAKSVANAKTGKVSDNLKHWEAFWQTKAATSFQNETNGADGEYAVPTQWATTIFQDILDNEDNLLGRSFNQPISNGNSIKIPCDNTTQLGQSGIVAYNVNEGASIGGSKASMRQVNFTLEKLGVLVNVTSELLEDTNVALTAYLENKSQYAFAWKTNDIILNGDTGSPATALGVIGHAATAVVADQPDGSGRIISYEDLCRMRSFFYGDRKKAVWVMGTDVEEDVMQVQDGAGRNIYFPPGGLKDAPYGTLFGIPVVISYHTAPAGTVGDIVLGDFSKYIVASKGTMQAAMTPYLYFDQQLMTFRWTFRMYGQPERATTLLDKNGLRKLGNFVTLATRSGEHT